MTTLRSISLRLQGFALLSLACSQSQPSAAGASVQPTFRPEQAHGCWLVTAPEYDGGPGIPRVVQLDTTNDLPPGSRSLATMDASSRGRNLRNIRWEAAKDSSGITIHWGNGFGGVIAPLAGTRDSLTGDLMKKFPARS